MTALYPTLWVGPAGGGKLTAARAALGVPASKEPRLQTLEIGDYTARYWEFPTHMEIDIMDLSMMDKQILPELLTQLLSTRDVKCAGRKIMIVRRIHALSPPAAARFRAVLEELVWSAGATAMIWCTARVMNGVVASLCDGFVYRRVPSVQDRPDRGTVAAAGAVSAVPTVQTYVAEVLRQMVIARGEGPPCLAVADWIRGRVYDLLGLMITGGELVSGLVWATVRLAAAGGIQDAQARAVLDVLARARWFPSYRTPIMLEMILTAVYEGLAPTKEETLRAPTKEETLRAPTKVADVPPPRPTVEVITHV
jgi:hypothetical protein